MSGNSLFVQEEEEEEDIKPQVDMDDDIAMGDSGEDTTPKETTQETTDTTVSETATETPVVPSKHHLQFIKQEEEEADDVDEDDPIVESYSMFMAGKDENLHVLQFANKAKLIGKKATEHPIIAGARYKTKSNEWELDIPLDEDAFFNKYKAEDKWNGVDVQTLKGVGVPNEGQYAAFVKDKKIYLAPVKDVSQLRPYFKYIDSAIMESKKEESKQNPTPASQKAQMVTMSVKSVSDPSQNRLTGSLLAHKIAAEEDPKKLQWIEGTAVQFQETIIKEAHEHFLKPVDNEEKYVAKLFA